MAKDDHVFESSLGLVLASIYATASLEVLVTQGKGNPLHLFLAVAAIFCGLQNFCVYVRGEDFAIPFASGLLEYRNSHGIWLCTGRAGSGPKPKSPLTLIEPSSKDFSQLFEVLSFAKEVSDIRRYGVEQVDELSTTLISCNHTEILLMTRYTQLAHPLTHPGTDEGMLAFTESNATDVVDQRTELIESGLIH